MANNYFASGEWNLCCDVCGKKIKSSEAKQRWDGMIVCPKDFEARHQQDFVKAKIDKIVVPYTRPPETLTYIVCTLESTVGRVGLAVVGCSIVGKTDAYGK